MLGVVPEGSTANGCQRLMHKAIGCLMQASSLFVRTGFILNTNYIGERWRIPIAIQTIAIE
jgi:hypothetical protein